MLSQHAAEVGLCGKADLEHAHEQLDLQLRGHRVDVRSGGFQSRSQGVAERATVGAGSLVEELLGQGTRGAEVGVDGRPRECGDRHNSGRPGVGPLRSGRDVVLEGPHGLLGLLDRVLDAVVHAPGVTGEPPALSDGDLPALYFDHGKAEPGPGHEQVDLPVLAVLVDQRHLGEADDVVRQALGEGTNVVLSDLARKVVLGDSRMHPCHCSTPVRSVARPSRVGPLCHRRHVADGSSTRRPP